jgi:hypothetical protein
MSSGQDWGVDNRRRGPGLLAGAAALALVGGLVVVGGVVTPQSAQPVARPESVVGRSASICTVAEPVAGEPDELTAVAAVASSGSSQPGKLTGSKLTGDKAELTVTEPGRGVLLSGVDASVELTAEGGLASGSAGAVVSESTSGPRTGLAAAPCLAPATQHWFAGIGFGPDRTSLVLTNPDDAQAEVDLRFYSRRGRVAVPGSTAVEVPAHARRTVTLSALDPDAGPYSLDVHAASGRVSAIAQRTRAAKLKPTGVDWQLPSAAPSTTTVIGAIPSGPGARTLTVVNPGEARASVKVQVMGLQGLFRPTGAETLEIAPESSASVELSQGLGGDAAALELSSDQPVTASVTSSSDVAGQVPDLSVQSATTPWVRNGVSALATTVSAEAELVLSNPGDIDVPLSFEVFNYTGVSLRREDVLVTVGGTATRRLTNDAPSYVVVTVPGRSPVIGGVVLTQTQGDVAGLAGLPLSSTDPSARAPDLRSDPSVGR